MNKKRVRKPTYRRGASRPQRGTSAWLILLIGILIGLGISTFVLFRDKLPEFGKSLPVAGSQSTPKNEEAIVEEPSAEPVAPSGPRYDFFTVLPEMEVVVPEQELSEQAAPLNDRQERESDVRYVLQIGSFQNAADAEQTKARVALLGIVANVQQVTVNEVTWHRVRVGPVNSARRADELRRTLQDNQIETLVMRATP